MGPLFLQVFFISLSFLIFPTKREKGALIYNESSPFSLSRSLSLGDGAQVLPLSRKKERLLVLFLLKYIILRNVIHYALMLRNT